MKRIKKTVASILTVMSLSTTLTLCACGRSEKTSYEENGIHYETEYVFEEVLCRVPFTDFVYHDGISDTQLLSNPKTSEYIYQKRNKDNVITNAKITATPDFAENLGSKWKKYRKQYGLAEIYFEENIGGAASIILNDACPIGNYRIEYSVSGMQCVKRIYGYIDGEKVSEESVLIGTFAPYKDASKHLKCFGHLSYADDLKTVTFSPYSDLSIKTVLLN